MALPKINQPIFEVEVPSTGLKTTFRPFTVREEKILLMAQESKDMDQIILALNQIINNCVHDVDVTKLTTFDVEYLFVRLRAASVNNIVAFVIEDPDTNEEVELTANLDDMKIYRDPRHTTRIELADDLTLIMRYPKIDVLRRMMNITDENTVEGQTAMFDIMKDCMHQLVDGEDVYTLSDFSASEIDEFLDGLSTNNVLSIKKFFDTMPKLEYEIPYTTSDGKQKRFVVSGTKTLFLS